LAGSPSAVSFFAFASLIHFWRSSHAPASESSNSLSGFISQFRLSTNSLLHSCTTCLLFFLVAVNWACLPFPCDRRVHPIVDPQPRLSLGSIYSIWAPVPPS